MGTQRWLLVALIACVAACASHHASSPGSDDSDRRAGNEGQAGSQGVPKAGAGGRRFEAQMPTGGTPSGRGGSPGQELAGRGGSMAAPGSPLDVGTELDSAIVFSPVFSAYDGVHQFRVPVTVRGYSGIKWTTDRPNLVDLEEVDASTVMITTRGPGEARIIARAGALSGSTLLTITQSTPDEWAIGEALYNKGVMPPISGSMPSMGIQVPADVSCAGCHGSGAQALSVTFTPQQTGGYSDSEFIGIFADGLKPPKPGWKTGIPMPLYTLAHTWPNRTEAQVHAMLTYLRSLEPNSQGQADFGGR